MTKRSKRRRVLIVTDDTSVATRVAELLVERGYEASVHRNPADLMAAASADSPDLVILCVAVGVEPNYSLGTTLMGMFEVPYIVLATAWDEGAAHAAAQNGALAFLASAYPNLHDCVPVIIAALERHAERRALQQRLEQVIQALQHARTISTACGVLMERMHLNRSEAFETLRATARSRRMRLLDTAAAMLAALEALNEVGETGAAHGVERDCDRVRSPLRKSR